MIRLRGGVELKASIPVLFSAKYGDLNQEQHRYEALSMLDHSNISNSNIGAIPCE